MFDQVELEGEFFAALRDADAQIAAAVGEQGCGRCGGRLHRGDYPRKPRGALVAAAAEEHVVRFSFCCGRDGCRRRTTPPSLRFMGRRVYIEAVVLIASVVAAIGGVGRGTARQVGVPARTLARSARMVAGVVPCDRGVRLARGGAGARDDGRTFDDADALVARVALAFGDREDRLACAAVRAPDDSHLDDALVSDPEGPVVIAALAQRMA